MQEPIKLLLVDDEANILKAVRRLLADEPQYEILSAESGEEGLRILEHTADIRLVVADYRMPQMDGIEFLTRVYQHWPDIMRMVLSGYADIAVVVDAINQGHIYRFIGKPWNDENLKNEIASALRHQELQLQVRTLNEELLQKNAQLLELNNNLEAVVERRTEDLALRNQVLQVAQGVLDVLPVAVFCIDAERTIVQMNECASSLCPLLKVNPMGCDSREVFPAEINALIDHGPHQEDCAEVEIGDRRFKTIVRRIENHYSRGTALMLVPEQF